MNSDNDGCGNDMIIYVAAVVIVVALTYFIWHKNPKGD